MWTLKLYRLTRLLPLLLVIVSLFACDDLTNDTRETETLAEQQPIEQQLTDQPTPESDPSNDESDANSSSTAQESFTFPHDISDLAPDPAVRYGQLENGMRYAIMVNSTPSGTAAVRLHFSVGAFYEGDDEQTLAHFLEHMAFNGSENVPEGEMIRILERNGLAFGADTNAATGPDQTIYELNLPSVENEVVDTAFFLMRETADKLLFDPEAIDRERGVVASEQRFRNTWQQRSLIAYFQALVPDTLIGFRLDDKQEAIASVSQTQFLRLYNDYYTPERALFVITGDIDPEAMETKIQETFASWEQPENPAPSPDIGTVATGRPLRTGFFQDPDTPTIIDIATSRPAINPADSAESRNESRLRFLANEIVTRRFATLARQPNSPILEGSASYGTLFKTADTANIQVVANPETWEQALSMAEQELRRALEHGFTQSELQEQIANLRTGLENAADRTNTRANAILADDIVSAFHNDGVFTDPREEFDRFEAQIPSITPEALHEAFRAMWQEDEPLIFVSNNQEIPNADTRISATYTDSQAVAVEAPAEGPIATFAYTDFGTPGTIREDERIDILDARKVRFDNNVVLIMRKTSYESDVVRLLLDIGGGLLELPKEQPGLSQLIANAFIEGGLEAHSLNELQSLLAGRTVSLALDVGSSSFGGTYQTTADDLEFQLQLITAYITAPGFREEAIAQFRQLIDVIYDTFDATPDGVYSRDVPSLIRSGDPRFGWPTKETLLKLSFDDLRPIMERALGEGAIQLAIVGDIDEEATLNAVANTLGALPDRQPTPLRFEEARQIQFPSPQPDPFTLRHAGEQNRAVMATLWPTDDDSDIQAARHRELLRRIMDLKLIEIIREEISATYSPSSDAFSSSVFPNYGYMLSFLDVEPSEVEQLFAVVDDIAASLAEGEISEDELIRARRPLIEQINQRTESNAFWLNLLGTNLVRPERVQEILDDRASYEAITLDDLTETARTYLVPEKAFRLQILPMATEATE